jgi:hypothetical protein
MLAFKVSDFQNNTENHLAPVTMATIKKQKTSIGKGRGRVGERNTYTVLVGGKLVQPLWKSVYKFLKRLKIELPYDPAILLLSIYLKECKSDYNRDIHTPMFIAEIFTKAKLWNQLRAQQMMTGLKNMIHIHNGVIFSNK